MHTERMPLKKQIRQSLCAVFLLAVLMPVKEVSAEFSGVTTMPLKAGAGLFTDSSVYIFSDVPAPLINKSLVQTSFANGADLTLSGTGYVYVIFPSGSAGAQDLKKQGFTEVPFKYTGNIWSGLPKNYNLTLLEKQVGGVEKIIFKRWGVVVLSGERVVFETITVGAVPKPEQSAALIPEPQNADWWKQQHVQKLKEARSEDSDLVLPGDSITLCGESNGGGTYAGITSRHRALNFG